MKVKFLESVIFQGKFKVNEGDILTAAEFGEYNFVITLKSQRKAIRPKSELGKIFEIMEE